MVMMVVMRIVRVENSGGDVEVRYNTIRIKKMP